jgi:LPXTG-motif cell wall-anchored protein
MVRKKLKGKKVRFKMGHKKLEELGIILALGSSTFAIQQTSNQQVKADEDTTVRNDADNTSDKLGTGDTIDTGLLDERINQNQVQESSSFTNRQVDELPSQSDLLSMPWYAGQMLEVSDIFTTDSIKDIQDIKDADIYYTSSIKDTSAPILLPMEDYAILRKLPDIQIEEIKGEKAAVKVSSHLYSSSEEALRDASFYKGGKAVLSTRAKTVSLISKTKLDKNSPATFTGDNNALVSVAFDRNFKIAVASPTMNENVRSDVIDTLEKNFTVSYQGRIYHAVYHDEKISTNGGDTSEDGYFTFSQEQFGLPLQINGLYLVVGATFSEDGTSVDQSVRLNMGAVTTIEDPTKWDINSVQDISVTGDSTAKVHDGGTFYEIFAQKQLIHTLQHDYLTVKQDAQSLLDKAEKAVTNVASAAISTVAKGVSAIFGGETVYADEISVDDLPKTADEVKEQDTTGRYADKDILNVSSVQVSNTLPTSDENQDIYYKENITQTTSAPDILTKTVYTDAVNAGKTLTQVGDPIQVGQDYTNEAAAKQAAKQFQGGSVTQVNEDRGGVTLTSTPQQSGYLGMQDGRAGNYTQNFGFSYSSSTVSKALEDQISDLMVDNFTVTLNDETVYHLVKHSENGSVVYFDLQDNNGQSLVDIKGGGNGTYGMFKIDFSQFEQNIYSFPQMSLVFVRDLVNLEDTGTSMTIAGFTQGVMPAQTKYKVLAPQYTITMTEKSYDYITVDYKLKDNTPDIPSEGGDTPVTPSEGGDTPDIPSEGGDTPVTPSEGGDTPVTPGGGGDTPVTPGGGRDTPDIPSEGGDTPVIPSEGGDTPVTPGEGGDTPVTPGEGGDTPVTPGGGGDTPDIPSEGGDTPDIPSEGEDTPVTPSEGGDTPVTPGGGGDTPVTPGSGGDTPVTPSEGGDTPDIPSEGGDTPDTPSEGGDTPVTPGGGGDPDIPSEGGDTPDIPSEGGDTPVTPGGGGDTPDIPSEGGDTPVTPGGGGDTPVTPSEGGDTPDIPSEGGDTPVTPSKGGDTPDIPSKGGDTPVTSGGGDTPVTPDDAQEIDNMIGAGRTISTLDSSNVNGELNPKSENSTTTNGEELPRTGEDFSSVARTTGLLAILTSIFGFLFKRNRKDKDQ